jgi:hypothetical protein
MLQFLEELGQVHSARREGIALLDETNGVDMGIGSRELSMEDQLEIRESCNRLRWNFKKLTNTISNSKA